MTTPADVVRELIPEAPDDLVEHIAWEHTGFPGFWATDDPAAEMRTQVADYLLRHPHLCAQTCDALNDYPTEAE